MRALGGKLDFLKSKWDVPADIIQWATYYSDVDLALPQGVEAYVANDISDDGVYISPVNYIPANVGVLLFGITDFDEFPVIPYEGETQDVTSILVGSVDSQVAEDGFVLYNNRFVLAPARTPIDPHRCYIPYASDDSTPTFVKIDANAVLGDVSGEGDVNGYDLTLLYNYLLNNDVTNIKYGDQNGDGEITISDITVVFNVLLGI